MTDAEEKIELRKKHAAALAAGAETLRQLNELRALMNSETEKLANQVADLRKENAVLQAAIKTGASVETIQKLQHQLEDLQRQLEARG